MAESRAWLALSSSPYHGDWAPGTAEQSCSLFTGLDIAYTVVAIPWLGGLAHGAASIAAQG